MKKISTARKATWIIVTFVILVAAVVAYYQLLYKSPTINTGIVKLATTFTAHNHIVQAVRFSPDANLLATASVDSTVKIWNRETGVVVQTLKHPAAISYMDYSKDGRLIVTGSYDSKVRLWDAKNGTLVKEFVGHDRTIWHVAFNHDATLIASSGDDAIVRIWEVASGKLVHALKGHSLTVWSVKFSPDGTKLATGSFDNTLKIWNVANGKLLRDINAHSEAIVDLAFSNNGQTLATTSDDKTIKIWNTANGSLLRTMHAPEHIQAAAFSPDDKRLMTGGRDKQMFGEFLQEIFGDSWVNKGVSARLWDVQTGKILHTFSEQGNDVNDVAYSNDGRWIATASADNTVCIWQVLK